MTTTLWIRSVKPMIQAVIGLKGSGKTKRMIDMANDALKVEHGNIVFIDDDKRYMYDLRHEIRFVDISEYIAKDRRSADAFLSFVGGMLAANYDITLICVDAFYRLVNTDWADMEELFARLNALSEAHHCTFLLSLSADPATLPEFITKYAI